MLNDAILVRLQRATGIDLSSMAVSGAVKQRMKDCALVDHGAYAHRALHDGEELDALIDLVVVPETWFFRDAEALTAACAFVQEKLTSAPTSTRPLRLLSVPCASGEEPASLAMALLDAGVNARDFTIEAVDVSRQSIERLQRGVYHRNAFRTADLVFRDCHFTNTGSGYALNAPVRAQVRSYQGNLLTLAKPAPGQAFDVIFCRNLLIYFDEETQGSAIRKLSSLLADDGLLFVGYAEAATVCRHGFSMAPFPRAFALRKQAVPKPVEPPLACFPLPRRRPMRMSTVAVRAVTARELSLPVSKPASPELVETLLQQARRLADAGKTDAACAKYSTHLQTTPDCVEAHFMLGILSDQANASDAAGVYLRRAVYLDPSHYEALCHLALLADRAGQAGEAALFRQRATRVLGRRPKQITSASP